MIPVLRSLVSATCWLLHEWPRNTEVHQATVRCEQYRTLKQFILEQDDRRVQSLRVSRRGAERKQPAAGVQQAHPLSGPRFQTRRVFRPDVRAVYILTMRHPAASLIGEPRTRQVRQQPVKRDCTGSRTVQVALQVFERDGV